MFATIGVLYAVLLAFVVIIVWERFHEAEKALAAEAGHAATIYPLSAGQNEAPAPSHKVFCCRRWYQNALYECRFPRSCFAVGLGS